MKRGKQNEYADTVEDAAEFEYQRALSTPGTYRDKAKLVLFSLKTGSIQTNLQKSSRDIIPIEILLEFAEKSSDLNYFIWSSDYSRQRLLQCLPDLRLGWRIFVVFNQLAKTERGSALADRLLDKIEESQIVRLNNSSRTDLNTIFSNIPSMEDEELKEKLSSSVINNSKIDPVCCLSNDAFIKLVQINDQSINSFIWKNNWHRERLVSFLYRFPKEVAQSFLNFENSKSNEKDAEEVRQQFPILSVVVDFYKISQEIADKSLQIQLCWELFFNDRKRRAYLLELFSHSIQARNLLWQLLSFDLKSTSSDEVRSKIDVKINDILRVCCRDPGLAAKIKNQCNDENLLQQSKDDHQDPPQRSPEVSNRTNIQPPLLQAVATNSAVARGMLEYGYEMGLENNSSIMRVIRRHKEVKDDYIKRAKNWRNFIANLPIIGKLLFGTGWFPRLTVNENILAALSEKDVEIQQPVIEAEETANSGNVKIQQPPTAVNSVVVKGEIESTEKKEKPEAGIVKGSGSSADRQQVDVDGSNSAREMVGNLDSSQDHHQIVLDVSSKREVIRIENVKLDSQVARNKDLHEKEKDLNIEHTAVAVEVKAVVNPDSINSNLSNALASMSEVMPDTSTTLIESSSSASPLNSLIGDSNSELNPQSAPLVSDLNSDSEDESAVKRTSFTTDDLSTSEIENRERLSGSPMLNTKGHKRSLSDSSALNSDSEDEPVLKSSFVVDGSSVLKIENREQLSSSPIMKTEAHESPLSDSPQLKQQPHASSKRDRQSQPSLSPVLKILSNSPQLKPQYQGTPENNRKTQKRSVNRGRENSQRQGNFSRSARRRLPFSTKTVTEKSRIILGDAQKQPDDWEEIIARKELEPLDPEAQKVKEQLDRERFSPAQPGILKKRNLQYEVKNQGANKKGEVSLTDNIPASLFASPNSPNTYKPGSPSFLMNAGSPLTPSPQTPVRVENNEKVSVSPVLKRNSNSPGSPTLFCSTKPHSKLSDSPELKDLDSVEENCYRLN